MILEYIAKLIGGKQVDSYTAANVVQIYSNRAERDYQHDTDTIVERAANFIERHANSEQHAIVRPLLELDVSKISNRDSIELHSMETALNRATLELHDLTEAKRMSIPKDFVALTALFSGRESNYNRHLAIQESVESEFESLSS